MKNQNEIMQKLAEILEDVIEEEIDIESVTMESDLFDDLGLNSIGILYVAMAIEEEFDMKFKNEDMLAIRTVGDVVEKLKKRNNFMAFKSFREDINFVMQKIDFSDEANAEFLSVFDKFASLKGDEFETIITANDFSKGEEFTKGLLEIAKLGESIGVHEYTSKMLILLCKALALRESYKEKGIDEQIFWDSMCDLQYKLEECRLIKGVLGTFVADWFVGFYNLTRFHLGRLQFEVCETPKDYEVGGNVIAKGTKFINVHIPRTGTKLDHELVEQSYDLAAKMFASEFKGQPIFFACHSWMLYPWNIEVLNENSNMAKFYNDFMIFESEDRDYSDIWRLFDCEYTGNPEDLPEDTSLRRAYKERFKKGGAWGCGQGFFVYNK